MRRLTSDPWKSLPRPSGDAWRGRLALRRRDHDGGSAVPWLIAGAVVLGVGYLAWTYVGPDVRRYAKIHAM
jgi:hypothetical protein